MSTLAIIVLVTAVSIGFTLMLTGGALAGVPWSTAFNIREERPDLVSLYDLYVPFIPWRTEKRLISIIEEGKEKPALRGEALEALQCQLIGFGLSLLGVLVVIGGIAISLLV